MNEVARPYRGVSADERRQQRRRLLLEACLDLVGRGGLRAVTAESVAAEAKLTKRYFYESFSGRDAILVAALDDMFTELVAVVGEAVSRSDAASRAEAVTDVFVSALCDDPRRARLYAEAPALPALHSRREDAVVAFTELLTKDDSDRSPAERLRRELMMRITVSGVTDVVTSWITGTLAADRASLTGAIAGLGRMIDRAALPES